jgi:hypothetical protein
LDAIITPAKEPPPENVPVNSQDDDLGITSEGEDGVGAGDDFVPVQPEPTSPSLDNANERPSKCARVEEVEDEDAPGRRYVESYPDGAAEILGRSKTKFDAYREGQDERGEPRWAPFRDADEWELAQWLLKNVGQMKIDEFLKLNIVSYKLPTYREKTD